MRASQATTGLGLAVVSAATFGTAGPFADALMAAGWTPGGAVIVRIGVAALVLTGPGLLLMRGKWRGLRRGAGAVVAYGLFAVAGCQLFFFNAIGHLSVGVALLLEYSGTLLVVLWLWVRHGQRPSRLTVTGGVVALVGLVLVLDLTGPQHADLVGVLWGLAAAGGLATYFVVSAQSGEGSDDRLPPVAMAWLGMVLAVAALALAALVGIIPFATSSSDVRLAGHVTSWVVPALGVALLSTVAAYTTGIAAARRLGARVASFVGLLEVLAAILLAWLLIGQRPSLLQALGGVIVLVGIALVRLADSRPPDRPEIEGPPLGIPLAGASS